MLLQAPHLYDISLLGLMWLNDARHDDEVRSYSINPLIGTLQEIGLITVKQHRAAINDARLRMKLRSNMVLCQSTPEHGRSDALRIQIDNGVKHLAVMLSDTDSYDASKVLASNGYRFYLTTAGANYAERKEGPYANIVTSTDFVAGYHQMRTRMAELMRATSGQRRPRLDITHEELEE